VRAVAADNGSPSAVEESVFDVAGRGKDSTYENGVRVPLIVAEASAWETGVPGAAIPLIGRTIDLDVNTLDVFNTLHTDAFTRSTW
jgi:arylsulfatase A-like enzyme